MLENTIIYNMHDNELNMKLYNILYTSSLSIRCRRSREDGRNIKSLFGVYVCVNVECNCIVLMCGGFGMQEFAIGILAIAADIERAEDRVRVGLPAETY